MRKKTEDEGQTALRLVSECEEKQLQTSGFEGILTSRSEDTLFCRQEADGQEQRHLKKDLISQLGSDLLQEGSISSCFADYWTCRFLVSCYRTHSIHVGGYSRPAIHASHHVLVMQ